MKKILLIIIALTFFYCSTNDKNCKIKKEIGNCKSERKFALREIESGNYIIFIDENLHAHGEVFFNESYFEKAVLEKLKLKLIYKDTIQNNFNIDCFKNTVDSILKIRYGQDYYHKLILKTDSIIIDEEAKNVTNGIYYYVHKYPIFKNDTLTKLYMHSIAEEIQKRHKKTIEGRVFCEFVIDSTGKLQFPNVVRGIDSIIDNECMKELTKMPKWTPGELYGRKVSVGHIMLPIEFKIYVP